MLLFREDPRVFPGQHVLGHPRKISTGGILTRCPSRHIWLFSTWRSSSSTQSRHPRQSQCSHTALDTIPLKRQPTTTFLGSRGNATSFTTFCRHAGEYLPRSVHHGWINLVGTLFGVYFIHPLACRTVHPKYPDSSTSLVFPSSAKIDSKHLLRIRNVKLKSHPSWVAKWWSVHPGTRTLLV